MQENTDTKQEAGTVSNSSSTDLLANQFMKKSIREETDELLEQLVYCDFRTDIGMDRAKKLIRQSIRKARMEGAGVSEQDIADTMPPVNSFSG